MPGDDHKKLIQQAFSDRPELAREIIDVTARSPSHTTVFVSIAQYVSSLKSSSSSHEKEQEQDIRPVKRQRVESKVAHDSSKDDGLVSLPRILLSVGEISFTTPQRKKLSLDFTAEGFSGKNPGDGTIAFTVRWDEIEHAICVPVPEKAQRQYNFCIFPRRLAHGPAEQQQQQQSTNTTNPDVIVWTVPDKPPETATGELASSGGEETYRSLLIRLFNTRLLPSNKTVVEPNEKAFVSNIVQAHRKGEKASHVKAFRGSKDGFLYFLPTGILWGFRKPLLFFSFVDITSISYTSVLQRTFDLIITTTATSPNDTEDLNNNKAESSDNNTTEYAFSMIDQEDFPAIDGYIKRHGLHDASMAEKRRAKLVNRPVEGGKADVDGDDARNGGDGHHGAGEDEDDEDEGEDYDPGSEGESEGSGTSSEEEGEGEGDAERDAHPDLGSELDHLDDLE